MKRIMIIGMLVLMSFSVNAATVSHSASEVQPGSFATGNYYFDGNVGIGTTSPNNKLHVQGGIGIEGPQPRLFLNDSSGTTGSWSINNYNGNLNFDNPDTGTSNRKVVIDSSGNVGIGTTTLGSKLHVEGNVNITSGDIYIPNNNGAIHFSKTDGTYEFVHGISVSGTNRLYWDVPSTTQDMVLNREGRLGLATGPDPLAVLHVNSTQDFPVARFSSDDGNDFVVDNDGRVGIGTIGPESDLHIHDSSTSQVRITTDVNTGSNNAASIWFASNYDGTANWAGIGQVEDGSLKLTGGNSLSSPTMVISDTGEVGIGTTTPGSKLQIGKTYADGNNHYLQIDSVTGAPPSADCDSNGELGKMIWDHSNDRLYICDGSAGWKYR